jgi:hypothetical protein
LEHGFGDGGNFRRDQHVATRDEGRGGVGISVNRRLARLTLGFSKKLEHLKHSVALSIAYHNFCRVHHSLQGETPAMAARLTDHVWTIAELLTESGQIGSEKWICPLDARTVSPPIEVLKAA